MPSCCVCKRSNEGGQTYTLTAEELAAAGPNAPVSVYYCPPCLKVLTDRESGAQLLKGLYEMRLRELGVANARGLSEQFHAKLLRTTVRKLH